MQEIGISGPVCSKLKTSFVNEMLKFETLISHVYVNIFC